MVKILRESNETKEMPLECIQGATLLSRSEAMTLVGLSDRKCVDADGKPCWWWTRTPGQNIHNVHCVNRDGSDTFMGEDVMNEYGGVRPALIISKPDAVVGDTFEFDGFDFKVISEDYALCDGLIGKTAFRKKRRCV